ncbi:LacI family DNA-binding transcriptional regulator [uncultured Clostridium sp.]|uniref:LacI family DNA-binding transcriptional regulator n=1 Tax=uncultured Clostridium sp. TaxID=59620 RepID=UPI00263A0D68|nr:LacI family DNA-binding transcriptional regulator [uncultured Clostridium sp.]
MGKTTLMDIAKELNVSKTTVSIVLNNKGKNIPEETKKKIFDKAKELNYIPNYLAKSLSMKKTFSIGVIVPTIDNPFFSEMVNAIEGVLNENGYSMILCNTLNNEKREEENIRLLINKAVDGIIVIPVNRQFENVKILESNNIDFVLVDRVLEDEKKYNTVYCDSRLGIKLGIEYLLSKGHENISFITKKPMKNEINVRLQSYLENTEKIKNKYVVEEDISMAGGFRATKELMEKNKNIDAIFYSSDVMAFGGIKYLLRNGYKIPKDINVLGFDNIDICSFIEPELTTVAQPISKMGVEGAKLLLKLINKEEVENKNIVMRPYLVERATVK